MQLNWTAKWILRGNYLKIFYFNQQIILLYNSSLILTAQKVTFNIKLIIKPFKIWVKTGRKVKKKAAIKEQPVKKF